MGTANKAEIEDGPFQSGKVNQCNRGKERVQACESDSKEGQKPKERRRKQGGRG